MLVASEDARRHADMLLALLVERGQLHCYEAVTQLEHALQCAQLAEDNGEPAALVIAALFHDLGHLADNAEPAYLEHGVDDRHEIRALPLLRKCFGADVLGPIARHVAAKRYLCAAEPGYLEGLSWASRASLNVQGGVMSTRQAQDFLAQPHAAAAIRLRRYDDGAKVPGKSTPAPAHFARYWRCSRYWSNASAGDDDCKVSNRPGCNT